MADPITMPGEQTIVRSRSAGREAMLPPYVVIADGPHRGARFPLREGENLLGRHSACHILLEDQSVSRRHCLIERSSDHIMVRDLGSKNGTVVQGRLLSESVTVGHADLVQTGIYTLRLITRAVSAEEELAEVPTAAAGAVEPADAEPSAETAAVRAEELAADADAVAAEAAATDDATTGAPRRRWPWLMLLLLVCAGSAAAAYHYFFAEPPTPTAPRKMLTRVIPAEPNPAPIDATQPATPAAPTEIPVFLDFASSPMPARVTFLDHDYGVTSSGTSLRANVSLTVGEQYTAEGHFLMAEFNEEYVERSNFTMTLDKTLVPIFFRAPIGVFKIEKLPHDVELTLSGSFAYDPFKTRTTTLSDIAYGKPIYIPYGRYTVELRRGREIGASGQFTPAIVYSREVFLTEDAPQFALQVTPEDLGQFPVEITSVPTNADVFIDTKMVGKTPYKGDFPVGEHSLILRKEGYFDAAQQLKNEVNVFVHIEVPLKTTAAGELLNDGHQLVLQGRFKEAMAKLSQVFERNPTPLETAKAQFLLGLGFLGVSDFTTAQGYFEQAKANPAYELRAKLGLVRVLVAQKKPLDGLPLLVEVMLRASDDKVIEEAKGAFKEVSPLRSVMYVRTDPPGATVYVNGEAMGTKTPLILHDLGLGNYKLRIEHVDFESKEISINLTVNEFNPVLVTLSPVAK